MPETPVSPPEGPGLAATISEENVSGSIDPKAFTGVREKRTTRINIGVAALMDMFAVRLSKLSQFFYYF